MVPVQRELFFAVQDVTARETFPSVKGVNCGSADAAVSIEIHGLPDEESASIRKSKLQASRNLYRVCESRLFVLSGEGSIPMELSFQVLNKILCSYISGLS